MPPNPPDKHCMRCDLSYFAAKVIPRNAGTPNNYSGTPNKF
jgi:hypothetical protein